MAIEFAQKGINWHSSMHRLSLSAALVALAWLPIEGHALGLGRVNVLSALGSPLQAEIDITAMTPAEASSLKVAVASQETYRSAGIDFNPVLSTARITLERRAGGKPYLRITSASTVTEPFVDAILDMSWSSGRLVREYTMLFDPPALGASTSRVQTMPTVTPVAMDAPAVPYAAPKNVQSAKPAMAPEASDEFDDLDESDDDTQDTMSAETRVPDAQVSAAKPPVAPKAPAVAAVKKSVPPPALPKKVVAEEKPTPVSAESKPVAAKAETATIKVKAGDTLSSLAEQHRTEGVSLDQMIVSLYRNNANAFFGNNMNGLKSGVVLKVPAAETSLQTSAGEARRTIVAQSDDFEAFRQRLAGATTTRVPAVAKQQVTGTVEAEVKDQQAIQTAAPDKLTLSKGGTKPSEADSLAKSRAEAESASRVTELSRNLDDLEKIKQQVIQTKPADKPQETSAPLVANSQTLAEVDDLTDGDADVTAEANAMAASAADVAAVEAPAVPPVPVVAPTLAVEPEQTGPTLAQRLRSLKRHINPGVMAGGGAVLALLGAGFLFWRSRRKTDSSETSFLESRLQPDSFFGASGGQRVDTRDAAGPSSMSYSLSQLDAIGDVDPLAEADVYLAYGRDLQAEEILKEALRATPERLPIHTKLMEVYAKRRDSKGVEQLAKDLLALTHGEGPDWMRAKELGLSVDPGNPLYKMATPVLANEAAGVVREAFVADQTAPLVRANAQPAVRVAETEPSDEPASGFGDIDLDISLPPTPEMLGHAETEPMALPALPQSTAGFKTERAHAESAAFDLEIDVDTSPAVGKQATSFPELDLSSISLDLDDEPTSGRDQDELLPTPETIPPELHASTPLTADMVSDPMQRKLELAQEFMQIGDADGARDLLTEVVAGGQKATIEKARQLLDKLS